LEALICNGLITYIDPKMGETGCKIKNIGVEIIQIGRSKRQAIKDL
jgi:hypothetical protein